MTAQSITIDDIQSSCTHSDTTTSHHRPARQTCDTLSSRYTVTRHNSLYSCHQRRRVQGGNDAERSRDKKKLMAFFISARLILLILKSQLKVSCELFKLLYILIPLFVLLSFRFCWHLLSRESVATRTVTLSNDRRGKRKGLGGWQGIQ